MKLKTVVFNLNSKVSKIISKTEALKSMANLWEEKNRPKKKHFSGKLNETTDYLIGINSCLATIVSVEDTDSTFTYSGYVEDVYDFAEHYKANDNSLKSKIIDKMNYVAYLSQEKGALEPYRVLIPFKVELPKK